MADAARHARVVVLCRPHNPTGTVESAADVERFLRRVPSDTVVLLDEAYVEFLAPEHRIDAPALVARYPNVVVLRTFSKAYGLAGLRIGYGFCAPELARRLWAMQLPFGIGVTGLVAVAASYDAEAELQQRIRMISAEAAISASCGCARWASTAPTATPTSSTCRRVCGRGARCSAGPACRCAATPTAACGSASAAAVVARRAGRVAELDRQLRADAV